MRRWWLSCTGAAAVSLCSSGAALADWTPLITADDFTGIQTDVMTVSGGIISVVLIIVGIAYLVRAMVK